MARDEVVAPAAVQDTTGVAAGETVLHLDSGVREVLRSAGAVGPAGTAYGLEASAEAAAWARRDAEAAGAGRARFLRGTAEQVPLPDRSVDVVVCARPGAWSGDQAAEVFRVLRPGGRLLLGGPVPGNGEAGALPAKGDPASGADATPGDESRRVLAAAGFVRVGGASAVVVKPGAGPGLEVRPMRDEDAGRVLAIYQAGLDSGQASFETTAPGWERFSAGRLPHPRFVAVDTGTGRVAGWVAASQVSSRRVYAGVVEHSVYVDPAAQGRGIGRSLLAAFIAAGEDAGVWTIQAGIFPENAASLTLHRALGFREVGRRERIGCHHGVWRDVLLLERRSQVTGL